MIYIAVCDDERKYIERITECVRQCLSAQEINADEVSLFTTDSTDELVEYAKGTTPDILFLDISMPGVGGIKIADYFCENYRDTLIIFVSNYEELVFYTMRFRPFRFVRKSKMDSDISEAMTAALRLTAQKNRLITLKNYSQVAALKISKIFFIETQKNYLIFHYADEQFKNREKLAFYEKALSTSNFVKINTGTLVNLEFISAITQNTVELTNHVELPLAKNRREYVNDRFLSYIRERENFRNGSAD